MGAGEWQLPAFFKAREMGLRIITVDKDPKAPGFEFAHEHFLVDTRDVKGCCQIAEEKKISGVMTMATDYALPAVSFVAEKMGLPGLPYETTLTCIDKAKVKEQLCSNGVPTADWQCHTKISLLQLLQDHPSHLHFPLVIKPSIGCGSKGVSLMKDRESLQTYISAVGEDDKFLIEEYLEGPEVSVEGIIYNNEITHLAITKKYLSAPPYFVEMGHDIPANLPQESEEAILSTSERALQALKLNNCAYHIEIRLTSKGPMIIEVGARIGGGTIGSDLLPLATGFDMVSATLRMSMGLDLVISKPKHKSFASVRFFTQKSCGTLKEVVVDKSIIGLKGLQKTCFLINQGEAVRPLRSSSDRMGYVIASGERRKDVEECLKKAMEGIHFTIV